MTPDLRYDWEGERKEELSIINGKEQKTRGAPCCATVPSAGSEAHSCFFFLVVSEIMHGNFRRIHGSAETSMERWKLPWKR